MLVFFFVVVVSAVSWPTLFATGASSTWPLPHASFLWSSSGLLYQSRQGKKAEYHFFGILRKFFSYVADG